jgi:very-short-patch-repair endonuclease
MADAMAPSESKALRLARYLREFVGLRSTTVYDVSKYESVLWFGDMPREPECRSPAWNSDGERDDPWLVVHKQQFPLRPAPPEAILPWIDQHALMRATAEMPELRPVWLDSGPERDAGDGEEAEPPQIVERRLDHYPGVVEAYERYRPAWEKWSGEYQRRSAIQSVYAELFRMHAQVQKQGEVIELVLGFGLLAWRRPGDGKFPAILRHMVTARVDISFDATTGTIRLDCGTEGAQLKIEDDMLDAELRPARGHYGAIAEQLSALGDDVWNRSIVTALKSWAGALHPDSEWSPDLKMAAASESKPVVSFAPALIMRRRNQGGMVRIYDTLIDRLSRDAEAAPSGWLGLVDDEGAPDQGPPGGETPGLFHGGASSGPAQEVYFPLPSNREQRRIVEAIDRHRGVLVQGPPGTGKSHTIANLVCHLLASGKRVLITAENGRALNVLKEKLPEEMRPLCVSLLGQGGDAFAELNSAVLGITTRFAAWRPGAYDERIADVDQELDASRRSLAAIDTELRSLREGETHQHNLMNGAYVGTASAIALRIAAERDRFGWLRLPQGSNDGPPVTSPKMVMWLRIRRTYDNDAVAASRLRVVGSNRLPAPAEFAAAVAAENEAKAALDRAAAIRAHPAYAAVVALNQGDRAALAAKMRELKEAREILRRLGDDGVLRALREALDGRQAGWQAILDESLQAIQEIDRLIPRLVSYAVAMPEGWNLTQVRADIVAVYRHLREGGGWTTLGWFTPKAVKGRTYLRGPITVNGLVADTAERLRIVCNHIDLALTFQALDAAWSDHGGLPSGSQPRIRAAAIREHVNNFASALDYAQTCRHLGRGFASTTPALPEPDWLNGEADVFLDVINAAGLQDQHRLAAERTTACLRELKAARDLHDAHPAVILMIHAVEKRDVATYSHVHQQVQQIEQAGRDLELRQTIETAIGPTVPGLIGAVEDSLIDPVWNERFADWEQAWRWALADNWLTRRADPAHRQELLRRREAHEAVKALLAEAAALRAWTHFFNRLSPPEAAALRAWRETVRSMGKGTGRSARLERLRQEARQHMDRCRDAIPVWIMPRYLVAEMIDPTPGRYDLVIVDEASQLGIDSLFLFYVSQKMVVVGDDQQISPYGVGVADQSIADLQRHYLHGIPFHSAFSAQSSLYGNAKIRFGQSVVLREHFRCMPEIIQFSNDLCYANNGTPLDPLRTYPANRLRPLVVRHVADGYRTGGSENATNEPEADAILAQIKACIADPRYAGRTMGVISLQGEAQAKLIEHKLLEALEPEVVVQRRLMCGDAYAFQGDERHIIFLSMVAAPGDARIGVLSTEQARQRFNVAASRAQDQLWLFHSTTLDVLSPACMRHRLLSYMLNPGRQMAEESQQRFDSQFERDVFQMIGDRGFHVRTQVCIGDPTNHRYRIDLVVEGMQGRLAVECDGDKWHGPERYDEDMARQRDLERAGWQFIRVRGGEFYRDRDRATEALWRELDRLGIRPGGSDDAAVEPPPPSGAPDIEADEAVADSQALADAAIDADPSGADAELDAAGPEELNGDGRSESFSLAGTFLANYVAFSGAAVPDPRTVSVGVVADGLCQIIDVEGPMIAKRAYDIYLRGCGVKRLGGELKSTMNRALATAVRQGRVIAENAPGRSGLILSTVRSKGAPAVKPRRRGPRSFDEIPPGELRAVGEHLSDILVMTPDSDEHQRAILESFDLRRLTPQVSRAILEALNAENDDDPADAGASRGSATGRSKSGGLDLPGRDML